MFAVQIIFIHSINHKSRGLPLVSKNYDKNRTDIVKIHILCQHNTCSMYFLELYDKKCQKKQVSVILCTYFEELLVVSFYEIKTYEFIIFLKFQVLFKIV